MSNRLSKSHPLQVLFAIAALALIVSLPSPLHAQTFQTVPALSFTKAFAGAEPLPQVLTIAYTDQSTIRFSTAASTNSGGSWLSVSPAGNACCYTPLAVSVIVTAGNLAAGTYTGQVVITNYVNGTIKMTIPVTLTVAASGATFFDDLPGKLSFSFKPNGATATPPLANASIHPPSDPSRGQLAPPKANTVACEPSATLPCGSVNRRRPSSSQPRQ